MMTFSRSSTGPASGKSEIVQELFLSFRRERNKISPSSIDKRTKEEQYSLRPASMGERVRLRRRLGAGCDGSAAVPALFGCPLRGGGWQG